jgi:hypothetical protein
MAEIARFKVQGSGFWVLGSLAVLGFEFRVLGRFRGFGANLEP